MQSGTGALDLHDGDCTQGRTLPTCEREPDVRPSPHPPPLGGTEVRCWEPKLVQRPAFLLGTLPDSCSPPPFWEGSLYACQIPCPSPHCVQRGHLGTAPPPTPGPLHDVGSRAFGLELQKSLEGSSRPGSVVMNLTRIYEVGSIPGLTWVKDPALL